MQYFLISSRVIVFSWKILNSSIFSLFFFTSSRILDAVWDHWRMRDGESANSQTKRRWRWCWWWYFLSLSSKKGEKIHIKNRSFFHFFFLPKLSSVLHQRTLRIFRVSSRSMIFCFSLSITPFFPDPSYLFLSDILDIYIY